MVHFYMQQINFREIDLIIVLFYRTFLHHNSWKFSRMLYKGCRIACLVATILGQVADTHPVLPQIAIHHRCHIQ